MVKPLNDEEIARLLGLSSPPRPTSPGAGTAAEPPDAKVSSASRRLRALATLSGSLTDSLSPEDAARLVEQQALTALGATSAVIVTLGSFLPVVASTAPNAPEAPSMLTLVHAIGLSEALEATLRELPLDAPVPLALVARSGQPMFLSSETELLAEADWGAAMLNAGACAAAIVPVWANGELRGVLGLSWPENRAFDEDERAFVLTLGVMCAQAILRAHLRAAERAARREAERANEAKMHFLRTLSHELRTPINAVMGYTELLTEEVVGPVSAVQKHHLGRVRASSEQLLALVEDLLGYARMEAAEEVVHAANVQLADVIAEAVLVIQPLADKGRIKFHVDIVDGSRELFTDPRKLRQILVNLLANAVKFTDAGSVVLREGENTDPTDRLCLEVSDTGHGIAPEDRERVFDPFWQARPASAQSAGSTGLGPSVARQLARLLGGDVTIGRSAIGSGSTFVVCVPARFDPGMSGAQRLQPA